MLTFGECSPVPGSAGPMNFGSASGAYGMKFWNLLAARWRPVALLLGLAALALPCAAQELQFPIYEFEVRGNSLLGTDAIEASVNHRLPIERKAEA